MNFARLRAEFFPPKDAFDSAHGVNTSGLVSLRRLRIKSEHIGCGVRYQPVDPAIFQEVIQYVPHDRHFIDLGCGKGRALILAHQAGFRNLTGVEFSPRLSDIAHANLCKMRIVANLHVQDVADFVFPQSNHTVIFLYNPFGPEVLRKIISRMRGFLVYVNPQHRSEFPYKVIAEESGFVVYSA